MKDKAYQTKIHSLNEMREKIREAFLQLSQETLENTWMALYHCLNIVWASHEVKRSNDVQAPTEHEQSN